MRTHSLRTILRNGPVNLIWAQNDPVGRGHASPEKAAPGRMAPFARPWATLLAILIAWASTLAQSGAIDPSFNPSDMGNGNGDGANAAVSSTAVQVDGKIIIGGPFTSYNGTGRNRIARLNADGSLDTSFEPGTGASSAVSAVAIQGDGKVIIGGDFTSYNGTGRNRIARLNADGSLDTGFNPGMGADGTVVSISMQTDGRIIIGGFFTSYNGTGRNYIARLNADGSLDTSFNPGAGAGSIVWATAVRSDGKIIIGGSFINYNGIGRNYIARLNADGSLDTGFDPGTGASSPIEAMAIQADGKVVIGGTFDSYNGIARNRIARLNADGSLDTGFDPGSGASNGAFGADVESVAVQTDGKIIIGGFFTSYNGISRNRIARLNAGGSLDNGFNTDAGANSEVLSIAIQADGQIITGGAFTRYNNIGRGRIARLNADGSLDAGFNPSTGANGAVDCTAVQANGKIFIGGNFSSYNGTGRTCIARLNADGSLDTGFDPGTGAGGTVGSIAVQADGKVIIGGQFVTYNGTARNFIARVNSDGNLDTGFNPVNVATSTVRSIAVQSDGKIIVGGGVTNRIVRLNADGSVDPGFAPGTGPNSSVQSIAIQPDGKIIIGGFFTSYNGTARNRIARLNADGSLDASFDPGTGASNTVWSTTMQADGKVIIGGDLTSYNGATRNRITRLNADGSLDPGFDPAIGANGSVRSIAVQAGGKIIISGSFTSFNGIGRNYIARLNSDGSLDNGFDPGTGANDDVSSVAVQVDGKVIIGGSFTNYNGTGRNRVARVFTCAAGTACDDGNACTTNDVFGSDCQCAGTFADGDGDGTCDANDGCPNDPLKTAAGICGCGTADTDSDNDGTANCNDGCPNDPLKTAAGICGCGTADTDSDNDGTANCNDGCPNDPLKTAPGTCGCGVVDDPTDTDGDGTANCNDGCPNDPLKIAAGSCGCGTPDTDTDNDGIADCIDGCPGLPGQVGELDAAFNPGDGIEGDALARVSTVLRQPDGKFLVAGYFTSYNGVQINSIARVNADGSLDLSFDPGTGPDGPINAMVLDANGKILVGGGFTMYNGASRSRIARLNADGTLDTSFGLLSVNNTVNAIAVRPSGKILIAGAFTSVTSTARNRFAQLNADGTLDAGFSPVSINGTVSSMFLLPSGSVLLGGSFSSPSPRIAKFTSVGNVDVLFIPGLGANTGSVSTIDVQPDGRILIGGSFTGYDGSARARIARIHPNGFLDTSFDPGLGASSTVNAIKVLPDGRIAVAGNFTSFNGTTRNRLARLTATGSVDSGFNPGAGADQSVSALLVVMNETYVIGGLFTQYNGVARNRLARVLACASCTAGTSCNDGDACSVNDVLDASCNCTGTVLDTDGDGIPNCTDGCPNTPGQVGTACDDGDPCTINDQVSTTCTCMGTPSGDTDGDGTCDANDICPSASGQIGSPCDDADPCTTNDALNGSCTCAGTLADADGDGVCDANDCAPTNASAYPGAVELCDGVDNDCDGDIDERTALDFDGADDHVLVGSWFAEQVFTIEMWLKPGSTQNMFANIVDNNHAFNVRWVCQQNGSNTNQYYFAVAANAVNELNFTLQADVWQHLALVKAPTQIAVYVNGVLAGTMAVSGPINGVGSGDFIRLGKWAGGGREWNGSMDDVRFWNTARTEAEIQATMFQAVPPQAGLVANYPLNDGVPNVNNTAVTTLADASGNGHTATPLGFALTGNASNFVGGLADQDADGLSDCIDNCPTTPGQVGSACNDNNACTTNDVVDGDCQCTGVLLDADGDGSCDLEDCAPNDPAIHPGAQELCDGVDNNCNGVVDELAQVITLRSGNGPVGQADAAVRMLVGPGESPFPTAFTAADFIAARNGPAPIIIENNPAWIAALPSDPLAKWVNDVGTSNGGSTGLYAIDFNVSGAVVEAQMTFRYAVDNVLGGGADQGVFLNGQPLSGNTTGGDYAGEYTFTRTDIGPLLQTGLNTLYVNAADLGSPAALIFSATITTSGCPMQTWYLDGDGDGYGNATVALDSIGQPEGYVADSTDCNDSSSIIHPGAAEICDGVDNDCDGQMDEGGVCGCPPVGTGCNDGDPCTTNDVQDGLCGCAGTLATEICDGLDNDCDGQVDEGGVCGCPPVGTACDDADPCTTNDVQDGLCGCAGTLATEICDGLDNDCDGQVDEGGVCGCPPAGTACNDGDPCTINDVQNGACGCTGTLADTDGDGVCDANDCAPGNASAYPGAPELCDGVDNDCDGVIDQLSALDFDGVNDHIALPPALYNGPWSALTVEAWIRSNGTTGDFQAILSSSDFSFVHLQTHVGANSAVYTDQGAVLLPVVPVLPPGEWHHVALSVASGNSVLYVDGAPFGASSMTFNTILAPSALTVGQGFQGGRNFFGQIRDLRMWNVARTALEVQAGMMSLPQQTPSLVLRMPLNDGVPDANNASISAVSDLSGNAHNGTLVNFTLSGSASNWIGIPLAVEVCDGVDNDCDGQVDEGCTDCSPADIALMLASTTPSQACVQDCQTGQANNLETCLANCYVDAGYSPACATCVVEFQFCAAINCPECQTDPNSPACIACRQAAGCDAAFTACSGLQDADGDGDFAPFDCDDNNSAVSNYGVEGCTVDGLDNDCDGQVDEDALVDADGDGFTLCDGDCNDSDGTTHPGAMEICDGADNDCDGELDEGFPMYYADADGDGSGDPNNPNPCGTLGSVTNNTDCDDEDPSTYPGAPEVCDGIDNDCNGTVDDNLSEDLDNDGFSPCLGDCDDADATIYPGAPELCDGLDNDCNGAIESTLFADADGDGYGAPGVTVPCGQPGALNDDDCDDGDPLITLPPLWFPDADGDGYGVFGVPVVACTQPPGYAGNSFDCNDADPLVFPGQGCTECSPADLALMASDPSVINASQACSLDCAGASDLQECFSDCLSANGLSEPCADCFAAYAYCLAASCPICQEQPESPACIACQANSGCKEDFVACSGLEDADDDGYFVPFDCNDQNASAHPDAPELCDGIDNDCDGFVDEACDVRIAVRMLLEGPYDPGTGLMKDGMRALGLVPTTEPYSGLGYVHVGGGGESTSPNVLAITGADAIVDWVLIELRAPNDPAIIVASRGALLQRDGDVVDVDGVGSVTMPIGTGLYHVAVRHRNHLGAMTAGSVALSPASTSLDLTQTSTGTFGTDACRVIGARQLLWCGDVTFDGVVRYTGSGNDRDPILISIGGVIPTTVVNGSGQEDVNMDGVFKYVGADNDRDPILQTIGGSVPTAVRVQQLP